MWKSEDGIEMGRNLVKGKEKKRKKCPNKINIEKKNDTIM